MTTAVDLIRAEHRHMLRVVTGLEVLAERQHHTRHILEPGMLNELGGYLCTAFGERHHAHEEMFLFDLMRQRDPACRDLIALLCEEHKVSAKLCRALCDRASALAEGRVEGFVEAVRDFSRFERRHMMREETELLGQARHLLDEDDLAGITASYAEMGKDQGAGGEPRMRPEFIDLSERIIALSLFGHQFGLETGRRAEHVPDGAAPGQGRRDAGTVFSS